MENKQFVPTDIKLYNAVPVVEDNISIIRDNSKCIDCGLCRTICESREGIIDICDGKSCVHCGQCVQVCPVGALMVRDQTNTFLDALAKQKTCIAIVAPAVRVAIGEAFGMPKGSFVQGKVVSALKKLGFTYVMDVTSAADLTIIEEAAELVRRKKTNGILPMFSCCCPSWVKYAEMFYPNLLANLSTCKSPISMQGAIISEYFAELNGLKKKDMFTVAITPCTSKKYEASREELKGVDLVLTVKELVKLIKDTNIDFKALEDEIFDNVFSEGTGAGMIFGSSGGVTEALIRTVYKILTNENLPCEKLEFKDVRGIKNVKEYTLEVNNIKYNFAIINKMASAIPILEEVTYGIIKYDFIEIMNCLGGCIGGGGLPKIDKSQELKTKEARMLSLYEKDSLSLIREAHKNPDVVNIYQNYLEHPLSDKAECLLHTYYKDKTKE